MKAGESLKLMKAMGAKTFDPMPPDQHKWQGGKDQPPIYRIWSWLCAHTIHWNGQERSAFAIDKGGHDLFIEHLAKDLEMHEANARNYWQAGKERGLWRNGTKEEGKRRLYLCGEVKPAELVQPTDPEISMYILIPDQILKKTKDWPPEKQQKFREWWNGWAPTRKLVRDAALAEVVGLTRSILDREDDTALSEWGLLANRQEHKNGKSPEETAARQSRFEALAPTLNQYVHTITESVQTHKTTEYKPTVQSESAAATLLPSENPQREPEIRRERTVSAQCEGGKTHSLEGKKPNGYLPAQPTTPQGKQEKEAFETLFSELERMQSYFKHTDFSAHPVSRANVADQLLVLRIVRTVGPPHMAEFLVEVIGMFKGLDRNAMGKLPPRAPGDPGGPRSLGLIIKWAEDYARRQARQTSGTATRGAGA